MKLFKLLIAVLISGACALSAHAQKQLKYLPEAMKGAKAVPYVVNPKLPSAAKVRIATPVVRPQVAPVARPDITPVLERQVAKAAVTPKNLKAPIVTTLPAQFKGSEFLTGPQALGTYIPGWRSELLLNGFSEEDLAIFEQTFAQTDQLMFETDANGNWVRPLVADWDYTSHFATLLSGKMKLKDHQVKTLFGKFSRLDDVFTRLNLQSFIAIEKRSPKASAPGDEGYLARHAKYNIVKRQPKPNPEVDEYIYGKLPVQFQTPKPSYGPKGRTPKRTPDEVLAQTEQFIKEHDRLPSRSSTDEVERSLRNAFDGACEKAKTLTDGTSQRLLEIKEQWVNKIAAPRTPDEVLTQVEQFIKEKDRFPSQYSEDEAERSLRRAFDNACNKAETLTDGTSQRLLEIKEQWVNKISAPRTSEEVLAQVEQFIKEYNRFPSHYSTDEAERSLRHAFDWACKKAKTLNDDTSRKLLEIQEQWVNKIAAPRTPDEILAQTEQFIKENGRLPSQRSEDETEHSLRVAFDAACKRAETLTDATSLRLLALKEQWVNKRVAPRTPDEVLTQTEQFIKENNCLPSLSSKNKTERSLRQAFDDACRKAEILTDATSLRLLALKEQWVNKQVTPRTPEEILAQVEQFIKEYNRLPSLTSENESERSLRHAFKYACKRAETLNDDTSRKLLEIKAKYVNKYAKK